MKLLVPGTAKVYISVIKSAGEPHGVKRVKKRPAARRYIARRPVVFNANLSYWPNLCRYSMDSRKALTISARR